MRTDARSSVAGGAGVARLIAILAMLLSMPAISAAQTDGDEWPKRVIRFIVSAAPGSAGDTVCRILAQNKWLSCVR